MKKIALFLIFSLTPVAALGEEVKITVKGMVCSFCAQGIKKNFLKHKEVEFVKPDLENQLVTVGTKSGETLSDETVKSIVTDAGYEVAGIERKN